jgi:hypothetical protein
LVLSGNPTLAMGSCVRRPLSLFSFH